MAFNPSTEEQVKQPDTVYKLPDGQTIRVRQGESERERKFMPHADDSGHSRCAMLALSHVVL